MNDGVLIEDANKGAAGDDRVGVTPGTPAHHQRKESRRGAGVGACQLPKPSKGRIPRDPPQHDSSNRDRASLKDAGYVRGIGQEMLPYMRVQSE